MTPTEAAWTGYRGDDWHQTWTRTTAGRTFTDTGLLVELVDETGTVVASSADPTPDDTLAIDASDCDFTDPDAYVFAWAIAANTLPAARYLLRARTTIDAHLTTFFLHDWTVDERELAP